MARPAVSRRIAAPIELVWDLLVDTRQWPTWGPTVRAADLDGHRFEQGCSGRVIGPLGIRLPFEITEYTSERSWSWRVAGVPATGHHVVAVDENTTDVRFTVPWPALPYLLVCRAALCRLDAMATEAARR